MTIIRKEKALTDEQWNQIKLDFEAGKMELGKDKRQAAISIKKTSLDHLHWRRRKVTRSPKRGASGSGDVAARAAMAA